MSKVKSMAKIDIPPRAMVSEGSFGSHDLGTHESTMELFFHEGQAGSGVIEWDIPDLDTTEHIGLTWDNDKNLLEYDGVFALPKEAITFLEAQGFTVSDEFRT